MSLTVQVTADAAHGEDRVSTIVIRRMTGTTDVASWGTYHYVVVMHVNDSPVVVARGDINHRYGDGALTLLRLVMEAADL